MTYEIPLKTIERINTIVGNSIYFYCLLLLLDFWCINSGYPSSEYGSIPNSNPLLLYYPFTQENSMHRKIKCQINRNEMNENGKTHDYKCPLNVFYPS